MLREQDVLRLEHSQRTSKLLMKTPLAAERRVLALQAPSGPSACGASSVVGVCAWQQAWSTVTDPLGSWEGGSPVAGQELSVFIAQAHLEGLDKLNTKNKIRA